MGNESSSPSSIQKDRRGHTNSSKPSSRGHSHANHGSGSHHRHGSGSHSSDAHVAARAHKAMGAGVRELQAGLVNGMKKLEEQDHPAAALLDSMCGPYLDPNAKSSLSRSYYSDEDDDEDDNDSRTLSEEETTVTDYRKRRDEETIDGSTYTDYSTVQNSTVASRTDNSSHRHHRSGGNGGNGGAMGRHDESSYETEDDDTYTTRLTAATSTVLDRSTLSQPTNNNDANAAHYHTGAAAHSSNSHHHLTNASTTGVANGGNVLGNASSAMAQPLASSFAKRCYFTKSGIGSHTQHYEGLTLTGNCVLMLAAAMKLKGCPTICDEDLRRVEQTYPNQFSRLPDELLLSSGWRRISKYCHFSNKPVPDGIPFFHSKQRLHPTGGYYFLLAAAVGMVRPIDVEPLSRDTLVLLETDFPSQCDGAPPVLIQDPHEWTLVDKFCFFSGGPINTDEDVYYTADFDGNPIYMLAFLSPSLTPSELYKLDSAEPPLSSTAAVVEVESVYDLTERDFDDLKLYHLGPCRALPQYILQPSAWTKVLPPHFLVARESALLRAQQYELQHSGLMIHQQQQQHHLQQNDIGYSAESGEYYSGEDPGQPQYSYDEEESPSYLQQEQQQPVYRQQIPQQQQQLNQYGEPISFGAQRQPHHEHYQPQYSEAISAPYVQERYSQAYQQDHSFQRNVEEEGAFIDNSLPMDEAIAAHAAARLGLPGPLMTPGSRVDPPEDEPPSLRKYGGQSVSSGDPSSHRSLYHPSQDGGGGGSSSYPEDTRYIDGQGPVYTGESEDRSCYQYDEGATQSDQYYEEQTQYEEEYRRQHGYAPEEEEYQQEDYRTHEHFERRRQGERSDSEILRQRQNEYDPRNELQDSQHRPEDDYYENGSRAQDSFEDNDRFLSQPYSSQQHYKTVAKPDALSPTSETEFSIPTVSEGVLGVDSNVSPKLTDNFVAQHNDEHQRNSALPPQSPKSPQGSEFSQSSAMRGAQELLRRNRQRRLEIAMQAKRGGSNVGSQNQLPRTSDVVSPQSQASGITWESSSEVTGSEVTGGSSIWTDGESNNNSNNNTTDRSSRRALILQMAKARMKNHKQGPVNDEEKKLDSASADLDLSGELD